MVCHYGFRIVRRAQRNGTQRLCGCGTEVLDKNNMQSSGNKKVMVKMCHMFGKAHGLYWEQAVSSCFLGVCKMCAYTVPLYACTWYAATQYTVISKSKRKLSETVMPPVTDWF